VITRRAALMQGAAALLCAPAIVRAESLMQLRGIVLPTLPAAPLLGPEHLIFGFCDRLMWHYERGVTLPPNPVTRAAFAQAIVQASVRPAKPAA
jgi:hypothetical protein